MIFCVHCTWSRTRSLLASVYVTVILPKYKSFYKFNIVSSLVLELKLHLYAAIKLVSLVEVDQEESLGYRACFEKS